MVTNAFYPSLNDFCTKYFVIGQKPLSAEDARLLPERAASECASLFEHLLLFDRVSLKVYGENVLLAFLYKQLGEKNLEALLEQEAIKFVLWTPMIVHMVDDIPGINALGSGNVSSRAHCDPEESFDLGLRWFPEKPRKSVLKRLKRKVLALYEMPPPELAGETVALTNSAFVSGKLKSLGFDPDKQDLGNLKLPERQLLGKCAGGLLEYRYLLSRQMTAISSFEYFSLFSDSLENIETSGSAVHGFSELAKLENMPDLKALFPTLQEGLKKVAKLREKRKSQQFRRWLSTTTCGDKNITEEYLAAITEAKAPLDTKAGKSMKAMALASVGAALGHAVEGAVPGALLGGVAAQAAGPAVEFALDLLDEFLLDGLRKGWHPRMFFDDLRKLDRIENKEKKLGSKP
jgi:hypothetical protein